MAHSLRLRRILPALAFALLLASAPSLVSAAEGAVIPLPDDVAKDLELLGEGVVGKAVPAPPLDDPVSFYMGGPEGGTFTYHVIKGEKKHIRTHTILPGKDRGNQSTWNEQIGDQYMQYMILHTDGSFGKFGEDDLDLSYGCHFHPGIFLAPGLKPGESRKLKNKALAYKLAKPDDTSYTGDMDITLTYVGAYEVTTPAGTWPASLMRAEFDIHIGPANVKDVQYSFYVKGVGRIAEIEALKVSALLIYHSHEKTAKVLAEKPKHAGK
jgi:hypothetical protein